MNPRLQFILWATLLAPQLCPKLGGKISLCLPWFSHSFASGSEKLEEDSSIVQKGQSNRLGNG